MNTKWAVAWVLPGIRRNGRGRRQPWHEAHTMDEHHFGAVFQHQICYSTVGQCDSYEVFGFQSQYLGKKKKKIKNVRKGKNERKINWILQDTGNMDEYNPASVGLYIEVFLGGKEKPWPEHDHPQSQGHWCWWICQLSFSSWWFALALVLLLLETKKHGKISAPSQDKNLSSAPCQLFPHR